MAVTRNSVLRVVAAEFSGPPPAAGEICKRARFALTKVVIAWRERRQTAQPTDFLRGYVAAEAAEAKGRRVFPEDRS